jgi:hypothetical protein
LYKNYVCRQPNLYQAGFLPRDTLDAEMKYSFVSVIRAFRKTKWEMTFNFRGLVVINMIMLQLQNTIRLTSCVFKKDWGEWTYWIKLDIKIKSYPIAPVCRKDIFSAVSI